MKFRWLGMSVIVVATALYCGSLVTAQTVRYNFMPGIDFAQYNTYKWVQISGAQHPDQIVDVQIKQAVDSQLSLKGLVKTDDNPDLYVTYQIAVNQEKQWDAYSMGPVRWGGIATATSSTISIGTLTVDFYDVAQKKQVWRGDATKTLSPSKNPEKNTKNLQKAVAKLLKNFPPPVKK